MTLVTLRAGVRSVTVNKHGWRVGRRVFLFYIVLHATTCYSAYMTYMPRQFRLSVHPSVTRMLCIKAAEHTMYHRNYFTVLSDRLIILVFRHQGLLRKSYGFTPNGGAEYKG